MHHKSEILHQVEQYVLRCYQDKIPATYVYHDYFHSVQVVEATKEIGKASNLSKKEMTLVLIAAWLHDIGYTVSPKDHEAEGIKITEEFLSDLGTNEEEIKEITGCIAATKIPQQPKNPMEEVLCDADLSHLSSKGFLEKSDLMREELESIEGKSFTNTEWLQGTLDFMESHHYFTAYGKSTLEKGKARNLKRIQKMLNKMGKGENQEIPKEHQKLQKDRRPTRGTETMFRVSIRSQVNLSAMADRKSGMLISVNSIVISIIISVLSEKFNSHPNLIVPTCILVTVCVLAIVFATLAAIPNVTQGSSSREDIKNKKANLLFFGNFHNMDFEDFNWGMQEMLKDSEFLYSSLIRDLYSAGIVIAKKFNKLRIAYLIFMYGLIASVLAFAVAIAFFPPT